MVSNWKKNLDLENNPIALRFYWNRIRGSRSETQTVTSPKISYNSGSIATTRILQFQKLILNICKYSRNFLKFVWIFSRFQKLKEISRCNPEYIFEKPFTDIFLRIFDIFLIFPKQTSRNSIEVPEIFYNFLEDSRIFR